MTSAVSEASPPRAHKRRSSIASRLMIWYFLSSCGLLLFSAGYLYWGLEQSVTLSETRRLTGRLNRLQHVFTSTSFDEAALRAAVAAESEPGEYNRGYIRIFDPHGNV